MKLPRKLLAFILFGCLGITTEIFYTAGHDLFTYFTQGNIPELGLAEANDIWKLQGKSYVYMFAIYGSAAFLLPLFIGHIMKLPLVARLLVYTIGIFIVEFITGWILDMTTGQCPWEYSGPFSVMGYINLSFTPLWMGFGILLEAVHRFAYDLRSKYVGI